jgi:hypothetical protein
MKIPKSTFLFVKAFKVTLMPRVRLNPLAGVTAEILGGATLHLPHLKTEILSFTSFRIQLGVALECSYATHLKLCLAARWIYSPISLYKQGAARPGPPYTRRDLLQPRQRPLRDYRDFMTLCHCHTLIQMAYLLPVPCRSIDAVPLGSVEPVARVYPATSSHLKHGAHQIYDAPWTLVVGRYIWYEFWCIAFHTEASD